MPPVFAVIYMKEFTVDYFDALFCLYVLLWSLMQILFLVTTR